MSHTMVRHPAPDARRQRSAGSVGGRFLLDGLPYGGAHCRLIRERGQPTDFLYLKTNAAFEELTRLVNLAGKRASQVHLAMPDLGAVLLQLSHRVGPTHTHQRIERFVPALGEWFSITASHYSRSEFVVLLESITERKRIEEQLRQSEQAARADSALLRSIMESPQEIVIFALDTRYCYTAFTQAHRKTMKAIWDVDIRAGWNMLEAISKPKDREKARRNFDRALRGEHFIKVEEYGDPLLQRTVYEDRYGPIYGPDGDVSGLTVFVIDVSQRKQVEAQLQRSLQRIRALSTRRVEIEESERRRLARELHDQVGQSVTAVGLNLAAIQAQPGANLPAAAHTRLAETLTLVEEITERIRNVMGELRPQVLDDFGLAPALRWHSGRLAVQHGLEVRLEADDFSLRLPAPVETACYRIAQEALTNIVKHARATQVTITLTADATRFRMAIQDNGRGLAAPTGDRVSPRPGWGLRIMAERAEAVGGQCWLIGLPRGGVRVNVEVPR
jgi:signal transduction histidine kinase